MDNFVSAYWQYLETLCHSPNSTNLSHIATLLENTSLNHPTSARELNNFAVFALINAENSQELSQREFYLKTALKALNQPEVLDSYPLCAAHLALALLTIGETQQALNIAISTFLKTLHLADTVIEKPSPGLIYFPPSSTHQTEIQTDQIDKLIQTEDSYTQSLLLLSEVLCRSTTVFYNELGIRLLHLAIHLLPESADINLKLGIACLINQRLEGILYLHHARQRAPNYAPAVQALYLAYRNLNQTTIATFWLNKAREFYQQYPDRLDWKWAELELDSPIAYVPFETNILLAVEPNFSSIVTSVLLAEGDWFEKEMEFWRNFIQMGMTVIDVGANVGVYTFSAAQRVGLDGCVIAIEPFSGCVRCLEETRRINQFNWVKICAGAASDRNGTAYLNLHSSSECNSLVSKDVFDAIASSRIEQVNCFTLDSLVEQEHLTQVDLIKIDAEGHELSVLVGSERMITQFLPIIMYENIGGNQNSNFSVAEFLESKGYQLFYYQPYTQKLISIKSQQDLHNKLNIIAVPANQTTRVQQFKR